jgi:putative salt-induced outer membrane protein YdiY
VGTDTTEGNYVVNETSTTETTAENYYLNGRYDRKFSPRSFWYGGAGWDRNRFSGIDNRTTIVAGIGTAWIDTGRRKFRTDYAASYTNEENVVEDPAFNSTFAGVRVTVNFLQKFGTGGVFVHDTIIDENLDATSDVRVDMTNSVAVSMTRRLALKVSLQWQYDNEPALEEVVLTDTDGPPPAAGSTVLEPLEKLDSIFTTSLVINF